MADKFTFTAAQRANLRTELATTLLYTELGGNKADGYKFSFAGKGKSGYSFGVAQIDVRNNASANTFLKSIGLTDSEISTLRSGGVGNELSASSGNDTLTGGDGADKFVFNQWPSNANSDVLTDFMATQGDQLVFDKAFFNRLAGVTDLSKNTRQYKDASVGGDDYIVYDNVTGNVYYDPTGLSNASAVLIATLQNKPLTMTANQYAVI